MFCHECGKKVDDNAVKCPDCGAALKPSKTVAKEAKRETVGGKKPSAVLIGVAAVILILAAVLVKVLFFGSTTLNPTDYVQVEVTGLDGEGVAELSFDYEKLYEDMGGRSDMTQREIEDVETILSGAAKDFSISKSAELTNGDVITIESAFEKKILKKYKIAFENGSMEYTVEGLTEIREFALNEYISLFCSGFDGYGYADAQMNRDQLYADISDRIRAVDSSLAAEEYIQNDLYYDLYSIEVQPYNLENVTNGDEITLTIRADVKKLEQYGIRLTTEDAVVTAEGIAPVVTVALADYVEVIFEGYNGAGSVYAEVNEEKLTKDLTALFQEYGRDSYGMQTEDSTDEETLASEAVYNIVSGWNYDFTKEFSSDSQISNGDVITLDAFSYEGEELYIPYVGILLQGFTMEATAEGLEEPQEVDLGDMVSVEFSGTCPDVYMDVSMNYDLPYAYYVSVEELYDSYITASNGDTFSWEFTYDEQELLELGYKVIDATFECEVSGLSTYDFTFTDLTDEDLQTMIGNAAVRAQQLAVYENDDILENFSDGSGWLRWDQSIFTLEFAEKVYTEDEYYYYNELLLTCHGIVPLVALDRSVTYRDVYVLMTYYEVTENTDGTLQYDDMDYWIYTDEVDSERLNELYAYVGESVVHTELAGESPVIPETPSEIPAEMPEEQKTAYAAAELPSEAAAQAAMIVEYEGSIYARYDLQMDWMSAKAFCENTGGHLAVITSEKESMIMEWLTNGASFDQYWIGATDQAHEGNWIWVTGEPFDWTDWNWDQPDNYTSQNEAGEDALTVGSQFGYNWNDADINQTEYGFILEINPEVQEEGVVLTSLIPKYANRAETKKYFQDPYGNLHFASLALDASERGTITYDLNGRYTVLSGNLTTWTEAGSEASFDVAVWGDGELLYAVYDYNKTDVQLPFWIDVTGVKTLTVNSRNHGDYSNGFVFLNETKLKESTEPAEGSAGKTSVKDLPLVNSYGCEYGSGLGISFGELNYNLIEFEVDDPAGAMWNLDGAFTEISGKLVTSIQANDEMNSATVRILLDGEVAYERTGLQIYSNYEEFTLDVTGKKTLEVIVECSEESRRLYVYLTDVLLTPVEIPEEAEEEEQQTVFPEVPQEVLEQAAKRLTYGNYQYYLFERELTWHEANEFCKQAGGSLANISDAQKQAVVNELIKAGNYSEYWMGGYRDTDIWKWSDGSDFDAYTNWQSGQPDNYSEKEYLLCMYQNGKWNDWNNEAVTGFVMEVAAIANLQDDSGDLLCSLPMTDSSYAEIGHVTDCQNTAHFNSIRLDASNKAWVSYRLDGAYIAMRGNITTFMEAADGVDFSMGIFGDGKLLYELKHYTKNMEAQEIDLDLTGVQNLEIYTVNDGAYDYGHLFLNEVRLEKADTPVAGATRLRDIVSVDTAATEVSSKLWRDAYGDLYAGYQALSAQDDGYIMYNLNGEAESFTGVVTVSQKTNGAADICLEILADGEQIFLVEDFEKANGAVPFELDVTGKSTLEIRTTESAEVYDTWIYVTGDQLR